MLKRKWSSFTITKTSQFKKVLQLFQEHKAEYGGFDTETTGLNIGYDTPFLFACGFLSATKEEGFTFIVDIAKHPTVAKQFMQFWHKDIARKFVKYIAQNIKFDLHMMQNINLPYTYNNVTDLMFYIRHGHDHIPERFGGVPLALKKYAVQYVDFNAALPEKKLKKELGIIAKNYNLSLVQRLQNCVGQAYKMSTIADMFKDCVFEVNDLPEEARQAYLDWVALDLPAYLQDKVHGLVQTTDIRYDKADRKTLTKYAHFDIIYMLEIFGNLQVVVENRGTINAIEAEEALIYPFFRMESTGFQIDVEYLRTSRVRLRAYILKLRQEIYALAGCEFKIGQAALIKSILQETFELDITSTANEELRLQYARMLSEDPQNKAIQFIATLQELRTLEKWYQAYIMRFLDSLKHTDRLYTSINQVGAVSCRVTSDFQQIPREGIVDRDGNELFYPRKMVLTERHGYDTTYCIDYSQIELRIQAFYTILVGDPDLNMCRAYFPYKCINIHNEEFDYTNEKHLATWHKDWYYQENPTEKWTPTDLHGVTTKTALGIDETHPDWKNLRSQVGKRVNFAENYGAQWNRIRIMFPDKTDEEITRIYSAYGIAYPGVKAYHKYCYDRANNFCCTANLFGIKYYNTTGHKLINLLVQGSAASLLKWKIAQIDEYIQKHKLKTKMQMQIHDELMFICYNGEEKHFAKIQKIMEEWEYAYVPIVAEVSKFTTNWAEKRGV